MGSGTQAPSARASRLHAARRQHGAHAQRGAVGIGDDYEADHLRKLVTPSSGAVLVPGHLDQLAATFGELVARIESFIATNAQLVVTLGEGVRARQLYRTLPQPAFIGDVAAAPEVDIRVGNVERDQTHAFLLAMVVPPPTHRTAASTCPVLNQSYQVSASGMAGESTPLRQGVRDDPRAAELPNL